MRQIGNVEIPQQFLAVLNLMMNYNMISSKFDLNLN